MKPSFLTFCQRGVNQVRTHGFRLLRYRYLERVRILYTKPVPCPEDAEIEVQTLVCQRDWLNAIWSLKSFRVFAKTPFRLIIHSDSSITASHRKVLQRHFPGAIIGVQQLSGDKAVTIRKECPRLLELRETGRYPTLAKVVDSFILGARPYYFVIDPDVLFFDHPQELLHRPKQSEALFACFNVERLKQTTSGHYCIDEAKLFEKFGIRLPAGFNCGLGWINRENYDWPLLHEVLTTVPFYSEYFFALDQTLAAIMCTLRGFVRLPELRYVIEPIKSLEAVAARHYYAKTRDLLYVEGIPTLMKEGILPAINNL